MVKGAAREALERADIDFETNEIVFGVIREVDQYESRLVWLTFNIDSGEWLKFTRGDGYDREDTGKAALAAAHRYGLAQELESMAPLVDYCIAAGDRALGDTWTLWASLAASREEWENPLDHIDRCLARAHAAAKYERIRVREEMIRGVERERSRGEWVAYNPITEQMVLPAYKLDASVDDTWRVIGFNVFQVDMATARGFASGDSVVDWFTKTPDSVLSAHQWQYVGIDGDPEEIDGLLVDIYRGDGWIPGWTGDADPWMSTMKQMDLRELAAEPGPVQLAGYQTPRSESEENRIRDAVDSARPSRTEDGGAMAPTPAPSPIVGGQIGQGRGAQAR